MVFFNRLSHPLLVIFFSFLLVRIAFLLLSGFDPCQLCDDCGWINDLSERALQGNFNFDIGRFIVSPFYNILVAGFKLVFRSQWRISLIVFQLIISSLSGVYLYKLAQRLFSNRAVSWITAVIYCFFPMTFWWVGTFCTEMVFQSFLIFSLYFLVKSVQTEAMADLLKSAVLFSITFLTKSHLLLFAPFIPLYYFLNLSAGKKWMYPIVYAIICFLFTLPFGLYNLKTHGVYVLSSYGQEYHFYTGNSEFGYVSIVDVPKEGTLEFQKMRSFRPIFFNKDSSNYYIFKPHKIKQPKFKEMSMNWIRKNPGKFIKLKIYNLGMVLTPGVSFRHYPFKQWLASFLLSVLIYLGAYMAIVNLVRTNWKGHIPIVGLLVSIVAFGVIYYVQNRFRTITLEPMFIIYASYTFNKYYLRWYK